MFYYEVVSDCNWWTKFYSKIQSSESLQMQKYYSEFVLALKESQRFHVGDFQELPKDKNAENRRMLLDDMDGLRSPYPLIWVDYWPGDVEDLGDDLFVCEKRGFLCQELDESTYIFSTASKDIGFFNRWSLDPFATLVSVGTPLINNKLAMTWLNKAYGLLDFPAQMLELHAFPLFSFVDPSWSPKECFSMFNEALNDVHRDMACFDLFLRVLSCMNVGTIEQTLRGGKIKVKKGKLKKQDIITYKTLVLKKVGQPQSCKLHPAESVAKRIHLCRGHFRNYTEESPLFGKFVGRVWVQPHVRGKNKDGIVVKDYKVEAGE